MHWGYYILIAGGGLLASVPILCTIAQYRERKMRTLFAKTPENQEIDLLVSKYPYNPTWYLPTGWLKMLSWLRRKEVARGGFQRELFNFPDGGEIALDYYPKDFDSHSTAPVLVILPGLNGDQTDPYVVYTAKKAFEEYGIRSVVYNRRGFAGLTMKGRYMLSWVRENDFDLVVKHLRKKYLAVPLVSIGFSMGANFTQFYLGEKGKRKEATGLTASVAVSPPHNLSLGSHKLDSNFFVRKAIINSCNDSILRNRDAPIMQEAFRQFNITEQRLRSAKSVRELDDIFTSQVLGVGNCDGYYNYISGSLRVEHVQTPLLNISSEEDPVIDIRGMPSEKIEGNPNLFQVVVRSGGHIEYCHGWKNDNWAVELGLRYLSLQLQPKQTSGTN